MGTATGLILAGGRSTRMGSDKALLPFPGAQQQTFVEHLISLLVPHCQEVILVARDALQAATYAQYVLPSVRIVTDKVPDTGPLMGLYSGLSMISTPYAFVTAVDTPFLQPALLAFLLAQASSEVPIIPIVNGVPQVLLAIYPRTLLACIEQRLHEGRRDPRSLLEGTPVHFIQVPQLRVVDPLLLSFKNINAPQDLSSNTASNGSC